MEHGEEKDIKMARYLAIVHIIVGFLLIGLGIADRGFEYYVTGYGYYGIWIGGWMCITGSLGILGIHKERCACRDAFACLFMGFAIISAVFGGIIVIVYIRGIDEYKKLYFIVEKQMALMALILMLGIVEVFVGIVAALFIFLIKPCTCCSCSPQQQADDDLVLVQTVDTESEGSPTQMATEPASEALGYQPHPVKAVTVCQPQKDDMPQFSAAVHGRYTRPRNQQEPLKI